jgi:hypothetical protein
MHEKTYNEIDSIDVAIKSVVERIYNELSEETRVMTAKYGTSWTRIKLNDETKTRNRIVYTQASGCTNYSKQRIDSSVLSGFLTIFDDSIIKIIIIYSIMESQANNDPIDLDRILVLKFIAILLARGVFCQKINLKCMWSLQYGKNIVKELMSRNKFTKIMKYLRFDNKQVRRNSVVSDKFVMIREVWEKFIENSSASYKPERNVTCDEQLLPSKSRCPFTQFMPNKPDKFEIKFWLLCEGKSKYICNGYPYLGAEVDRPSNDSFGEYIVKKLMEPYFNKGYHVTMHNYLTSRNLVRQLLSKKTTILGTMRKNRKELPDIIHHKLKQHDSLFYEDEKGSLLSIYQCKKDKNVIILSTLHEKAEIPSINNTKSKPKTILDYNKSKV